MTAAAILLATAVATAAIEQLIHLWNCVASASTTSALAPTLSRAGSGSTLVHRVLQRLSSGGTGSTSHQHGSPFRVNIIDSVLEYQDRPREDRHKTDGNPQPLSAFTSGGTSPALRQDTARLPSRLLSNAGSVVMSPTDHASPPTSGSQMQSLPQLQPAPQQPQQPQQQARHEPSGAAAAAAALACYRNLMETVAQGRQPSYVSALRRHQVNMRRAYIHSKSSSRDAAADMGRSMHGVDLGPGHARNRRLFSLCASGDGQVVQRGARRHGRLAASQQHPEVSAGPEHHQVSGLGQLVSDYSAK